MSKPAAPHRQLVLDFITKNPGCHGGDVREALKYQVKTNAISNALTGLVRDGSVEKTGRVPNLQYWVKGARAKIAAAGMGGRPPVEEQALAAMLQNPNIPTPALNTVRDGVMLRVLVQLVETTRNATEVYYHRTPEGSGERTRMQEILQRMNMVDDLMKGVKEQKEIGK